MHSKESTTAAQLSMCTRLSPPPPFLSQKVVVHSDLSGIQQLLVGQKKAGVLPGSIPIPILKEIANWFHSKVPTQSIRELLLKKQEFPKSISLDAQFFRNLRLYLEYHKIHPDMPVQDIQQQLSIDPNKSGIEYEDIMVCAQKACSGAAAAAREAFGECIEDLVAFLEFIQAKDPLFAKKVRKLTAYLFAHACILLKSLSYPCMPHQVCYLKGTNKISAIFSMTGYQRAKLANFGDVLIFDCKRSGITTLEWPKPIAVVFDQEGKLRETCTGMVCVEKHDM